MNGQFEKASSPVRCSNIAWDGANGRVDMVKEGEDLSKIRDIYSMTFLRMPAAVKADKEVAEIVKKRIVQQRQEKGEMLSEEEWGDLAILCCSYGQEKGFESGFKYALALLFECVSS